MAQRPIIPPSPRTTTPSARRSVVAPQACTETATIAPIVSSTQVTSSSPAQIAPRQVASVSAPTTSRRVVPRTAQGHKFVLEGDEFLLPPPPPNVTFGQVIGEQLEAAARELRDNPHRRRTLEEMIRADVCFADGKYRRSRRYITVEYVNMKKPAPVAPFSEDELSVLLPIIRYPNGPRFGEEPYLEFTDDRYATEHCLRGKWVPVFAKGMRLQIVREQRLYPYDRFMYRPCTDDGEIIQDLDIVGKITGTFFLKQDADQAHVLRDLNGLPIVLNDIKRVVCMYEWVREDKSGFWVAIIIDRARQVRCIDHEWECWSAPDPELDGK